MIRVHHLNASRSHRILWLLEELGLDYQLVPYQRSRVTMLAPRSLREVHPLGKAPVVEYRGKVLAESGAILEELVEREAPGKLAPARGSDAWSRYLYWMHYAEGSLMVPLFLGLVSRKMGPLGWPMRPYVGSQLRLHYDFMEAELSGRPYFAGDELSAADIQMSFPLEAATGAGLDDKRPNLWAWRTRIRARPAYQRALEKGGPLSL